MHEKSIANATLKECQKGAFTHQDCLKIGGDDREMRVGATLCVSQSLPTSVSGSCSQGCGAVER